MLEVESLQNVFAFITFASIVLAVLLGSHNYSYVLIGFIPLAEATLLQYLPLYSFRLNFVLGIIRVFAVISVNRHACALTEGGVLNYLDLVAIFLMCPSLFTDKSKNINQIFLYFLVLQQQLTNDEYKYISFRYALKCGCFLAFALVGLSKCHVQERVLESLKVHHVLKSKLDQQKRKLTKALRSAVGWDLFHSESEYTIDDETTFFISPSRITDTPLEDSNIQRRLINSSFMKNHNIAKFQQTVDATRSFNNVNRTDCILIAIKPFVDNTLTSCEAQNVYDVFEVSSKIYELAKLYGVTIVRKFGDVWIGCLGFFPGDCVTASQNVDRVIRMSRDVYLYGDQNNIKFTCALDCGNIFCGFFRGIFLFEVLGPEVMWVLSVCEFEREKQVFVSDSFHTMCKRLLSNPKSSVKFESILLQSVDKFHSGSNYILVMENKVKFMAIVVEQTSDQTLINDKVPAGGSGKFSKTGGGVRKLNDSFESTCDESTLNALNSLLFDELTTRVNLLVSTIKAILHCRYRQEAINSTSDTLTKQIQMDNSISATEYLSSRQHADMVGNDILNIYPPGISYDFGAQLISYLKRIKKHIFSGTFNVRLESAISGDSEVESSLSSIPDGYHKRQDDFESFESFRKRSLVPNGYFSNGYISVLLIISVWTAFMIGIGGWEMSRTNYGTIQLNIACIFIVIAFFNWVVPLLGSKSLVLPVCNVLLFFMYPECSIAGELNAIVIVPTWMVLCYSHNLSTMTASVLISVTLYGAVKNHPDECKGGTGAMLFALVGIYFLSAMYFLEYYLYMCYIVEVAVIPYENKVVLCYEDAMKDIYKQLPMKTSPNSSGEDVGNPLLLDNPSQADDALPNRFQFYENCVVIAVHVKATETFPDVGAVDNVSNILEFIYSLFDECIEKFGIIGMSKFAGIHLSAIRDDDSNSTSNLKRGVDCLQFILMKFRQLDQERYVNLKLGPTRDKAMQIAMKEENDVFFSSCFLNEMKIAFPDKKFKSFTGEGITSGQSFSSSNIKWYHLELFDAFNFAGNFGFSRNMKDYKYVEILGKGGNGTVHLLEDQINKIMVAVKIIEWSTASIDHIRRELSILQDLKHQNIVKIKFYVVKRVEMYIVMEYVRGGTLQQIVDYYKPELSDLRVWFMQLVLALEYIHARGIVHRDVKPSNCMIDTFGILKLTDFGLALQNIDKPLISIEQDTNVNKSTSSNQTARREASVTLSAPSLKLMQNIFPSSVQYNTSVGGNNRPKEGILLIDDDRQRLERTQSLLRQHFIVYSVNNDDEALDFLNHSIKKADNANEICLIIITIDVSGDDINGWGFLNILWNTDELKDIPVVALASSFSLKLAKAEIWEERLPNIKARPKQIIYHPFNAEAYAANRYYFDMICRLEKQRKNLGDAKHNSTVFDKMFSDNYYSKQQDRVPPEDSIRSTYEKMNDSRNKKKSDSVAGTIHYMAPEVLNREECNEKIDWWSCGVLFYYCVMGKKLFDRNSKHLLIREILNVDIGERLSRCYPTDLRDLMRNMLIRDVDRRFNSVAIRTHPFFRSVGNVSKGAVKKVFDPMSSCKLRNINPTTTPPVSKINHSSEHEVNNNSKSFFVSNDEISTIRESPEQEAITRVRNRWSKKQN